jgi:hypothetical protein
LPGLYRLAVAQSLKAFAARDQHFACCSETDLAR